MKQVIDTMAASTGWSVSGTGIISVTSWEALSADYIPSQLFVTLGANEVLSKDFAPAISTPYGNLSFSIVMRPFTLTQLPDGYWLKFKVFSGANSKEYYVPNITKFDFVSFYCPFTTINRIEFTAQSGLTFFISNIINYSDHMPYDLYQSIKVLIDRNVTSSDKMPVGVITGSAGGSSADITNPASYIDRYSVISFGGETHKVAKIKPNALGNINIEFTSDFDGKTLTGAHSSAQVLLEIPSVIESDEFDANIPGISITDSFVPQRAEEFEAYSTINDSVSTDGYVRTRTTGATWEFTVNIRATARHSNVLEACGRILRKSFPGTSQVWINGRRHEVILDSFEFLDYDGATDILPQINCIVKIYITEESWQEETQTQSIQWTSEVTMN